MQALNEWVQEHHSLLMLAAFLWVGAFILASVLLRLRSGRSIRTRVPERSQFAERFASGRSERSWFTRMGGANSCLMVAVTRDQLHIALQFPFNLMFMPQVWDLEHCIRRRDIQSVKLGPSRWIRIEWQQPGSRRRAFRLRVRQPDALVQALG